MNELIENIDIGGPTMIQRRREKFPGCRCDRFACSVRAAFGRDSKASQARLALRHIGDLPKQAFSYTASLRSMLSPLGFFEYRRMTKQD